MTDSAIAEALDGLAFECMELVTKDRGTLGPLTVARVAGVRVEDDGGASGLVNVTRQLGGSPGLGDLVAVLAAAGLDALLGRDLAARRVAAALAGSTARLAPDQPIGSPAARSAARSASRRASSARNWLLAQERTVKSRRWAKSCRAVSSAKSGRPICI
jgi:hypothetical protein